MKKIYISSSQKPIDDFFSFNLKRDLSELSYEVVNKEVNDIYYNDNKNSSPEYLISRADIFIAVIKGKSPFVFYELGYAAALGKKVLIISDSDFDLPLPLRNYNYLRLDSSLSNSVYNIINFLEKTKINEKSIIDNILSLKDFIEKIKEDPQIIDRISGPQFEDFVYNYFADSGISIEKSKPSTDYGFDLMLYNWNKFNRTIVEVKKFNKNSKVSVNTIQQIIGAMNISEADHAIIITTSEFTASAKEYAKSIDKRVDLWDINTLLEKV